MNDFGPRAFAAAPSLLGSSFLALWNDVEAGREAECDAWHTGEHVPQRVSIPGILSGRRYVAAERGAAQRYFTLYDLQGPEVLGSPGYRAVVDHPTPWSAAMRPSLRRFLRLPCRRVVSLGGGIGGAIATVRVPGASAHHAHPRAAELLDNPGVTAVHVGEPWGDGQLFPVQDLVETGEGALLLVEGTGPNRLRAALGALAPQAALYGLAFIAARPPGAEEG